MTSVPKYSTLGPRVSVNVVLKADQRTGKLTRGTIANILTKGDHPRGVKVRLESGAIGRVQSLVVASSQSQLSHDPQISTMKDVKQGQSSSYIENPPHGSIASRNYRFQEDFRTTEPPPPSEVASLADYIKAPSRNKKKKKTRNSNTDIETTTTLLPISQTEYAPNEATIGPSGEEQLSEQALMESEFPNIDTALVAAILGDCGSIAQARTILRSLS